MGKGSKSPEVKDFERQIKEPQQNRLTSDGEDSRVLALIFNLEAIQWIG